MLRRRVLRRLELLPRRTLHHLLITGDSLERAHRRLLGLLEITSQFWHDGAVLRNIIQRRVVERQVFRKCYPLRPPAIALIVKNCRHRQYSRPRNLHSLRLLLEHLYIIVQMPQPLIKRCPVAVFLSIVIV